MWFQKAKNPLSAKKPQQNRRQSKVAPATSIKRRLYQRFFKAGMSEHYQQWNSNPITPDTLISQELCQLVARSREQWANNDHVKKFIFLVSQNIRPLA